jgi:hypothetical protein
MIRTEALPRTPCSVPCKAEVLAHTAPLLIQVPQVSADRAYDWEPTAFQPGARAGMAARRPGRRLRKEIRLAGGALLVLIPLALACSQWAPAGTLRRVAVPRLAIASRPEVRDSAGDDAHGNGWAAADESDGAPPSVLLSIETAGAAADSDCAGAVVLPGYLLPDDNHEELAHEGS